MISCRNCGQSVPENYGFCNHCGTSLNAKQNSTDLFSQSTLTDKKSPSVMMIIGLLIVAVIIANVSYSFYKRVKRDQFEMSLRERPTEVTEKDFPVLCSPTEKCLRHFIVWRGVVLETAPTGSKEIMLKTFNGRARLSSYTPLTGTLQKGDLVLFDGFIEELNTFSADSIIWGYVRTTLATADQQQAEEQHQEEIRNAKLAEEQKAKDTALAAAMGISLSEYVAAKDRRVEAHVACTAAVVKGDEWGGSADWLPNFSWKVTGDYIDIQGDDVQLKNAFNAERRASYSCLYNLTNKLAVVVSVN